MSVAFDETGASRVEAADTGGLGGHPRGLTTLFFTEMWERFSYYGMRAILLLYMVTPLAGGGLALDRKFAALVYGTYVSSVYWMPLIGGWLADKVFGARRAVLLGGIIIASGHFSMVFPSIVTFYLGLCLIAVGTGLLKPNISTMVGDLYSEGDTRRDAGFSIFYMGINIGAMTAPLVCGFLAQQEWFRNKIAALGFDPASSWHWGFGAAGVGMTLGIVQYVLGGGRLRGVGQKPQPKREPDIDQVKAGKGEGFDMVTLALSIICGVVGAAVGVYFGEAAVSALFPGVVGFFVGYLIGTARQLSGDELKRVLVIFILFLFSVMFWMTFEQAGSSLTLFADKLTRNNIFGWEFPSSWFQSVQPTFVILLAPVFAGLWMKLGRKQPTSPGKFALGLLFAGLAFALVALASTLTGGGRVSPWWLVLVYLIQTFGELCLSPVGLSTVTKLSPARMVGLMMGVWFLSISIGSFIAGLAAGLFNENAEGALFRLFGIFALISLAAAGLLALLTPAIKRMTPRTS
ncbi:MAG TPA: peptide MFS transporter [Pyrinomonadaceae bacterium]|jgi:POT family proton-dependent oligopeptide transporter